MIKNFFFIFCLSISLHATDIRSLLFHGNCITCHDEHTSISAPSTNEIKSHYLKAFPNKEDFVSYMATWILKPQKETSLMLHSIKKYELMPLLGFDEETLRDIAGYIYDTDFSKVHPGHIN